MTTQNESQLMRKLTAEAARIFCEESLWDYRSAKLKALQRLGLPPRSPLPDNQCVQAAVLEYQRLYGGDAYYQQLWRMRKTAIEALKLLAACAPRLTGAAVTGAVTAGQRVQLHAFADAAEELDLLLEDRCIPHSQDERRYRYRDGREQIVPLARFVAGEVGVDVAVFYPHQIKLPPISPTDGLPMPRLRLTQVEALMASSASRTEDADIRRL